MVCAGLTVAVPDKFFPPLHPPDAAQVEAFCEDHERIDELPRAIELGFATMDTKGGVGDGEGFGLADGVGLGLGNGVTVTVAVSVSLPVVLIQVIV